MKKMCPGNDWEEVTSNRLMVRAEQDCFFVSGDGTKVKVNKGETVIIGDAHDLILTTGFDDVERKVEVIRGNKYICEPLNPLRKKNRGRICKVVDHDDWSPVDAYVIWEDTGRMGKVDLSDLVAIK